MAFKVEGRDSASMRVIVGLQEIYRKEMKDLEEKSFFYKFQRETLSESELQAKTHVLIMGPYSTGKTTFIRYLLGKDFKSMNIGPEPTTDTFTVLMHGEEDHTVPGNTLTLVPTLPYSGLQQFGTGFLKRLCGCLSTSNFLEHLTIIDTPGALTGEELELRRSYRFPHVSHWFADHSDLIILVFDAHKLDISDELREVMEKLLHFQDKIRIVLNKADQIDHNQLMRTYGSLMWTIGNIFPNPEVIRVYVGSFWDKPYKHKVHEGLFNRDKEALANELASIPKDCAINKTDKLAVRVRKLKAHLCLVGHIRNLVPMWGSEIIKQRIMNDLPKIFSEVMNKYDINESDMPEVVEFGQVLKGFSLCDLPLLRTDAIHQLDSIIKIKIPKVLSLAGGDQNVIKIKLSEQEKAEEAILDRTLSLEKNKSLSFTQRMIGGGSKREISGESSLLKVHRRKERNLMLLTLAVSAVFIVILGALILTSEKQ
mmetsp:Transcript_662/g.932  ORF Transcript_662/g.932 Transcript_662/m.932 type:complete len:482 (+) Transcript_662:66-1511(+)